MRKINKKLLSIVASITFITVIALSFVTSFKSSAASDDSSTITTRSHVKSENDSYDSLSNDINYPDFIDYDFGVNEGSDSVSIDTKVTENIKKNTLVSNKKDSESVVIGILGDGFTSSEQDKFNENAKEISDYIISNDPFSEMKDKINIYSANINSKESGVTYNPSDKRDTFFKTSLNNDGIERRMKPKSYVQTNRVAKQVIGDCDTIIILANDTRKGGTACFDYKLIIMTLADNKNEVVLHELGHSIGDLRDEYWPGENTARESPNMTQNKYNPPWKDLMGVDGVDVYPYKESPSWFKPSNNCKMQHYNRPFCPVCRRQLIKRMNEIIESKKEK